MIARTVSFEALHSYLVALKPGPTPDTVWTLANIGALCGVSKQAVHQWQERGINPWQADRIAVRLHSHVWIIWGAAWEAAAEADEQARAKSVERTIRRPWRWPDGYVVNEEMAA
jgi:hypothetical protein